MAIKHMQGCLTSLVIMKCTLKQRDTHFTPVEMAVIKQWTITSVSEYVDKLEPSYTVHGNARWFSPCVKQLCNSSKS